MHFSRMGFSVFVIPVQAMLLFLPTPCRASIAPCKLVKDLFRDQEHYQIQMVENITLVVSSIFS